MEIKYGEKRSQIIIAGILILCIVAIFVGFALVIGVSKTDSQISILQAFDKILNNSELGIIGYDTDVSTGDSGDFFDVPVAQGEISYLSSNFPPESWTELPLCITDADVASWYVTLYVTGGYAPQSGSITFTQCSEEQYINILWTETATECCYSEWTATFDVAGDCIKFMSSETPEIDLPFPYYEPAPEDWDYKLVDIHWCTCWTGCHFCLMLIHKRYLSGIPQFPNVFHRQL